ncbi:hypothetical protein [Acetobacterium wieringae]|uniref:hypothetical protein n=1 Tax=Acetobacterium wieringae TaxID=52694 RepID=UPI0026F1D49B|nr:hypothetical protein [Acetobacterium wieringae]
MRSAVVFGLEPQEMESIVRNLPQDTDLSLADVFTDIIAYPGFAYIINPWKLDNKDLEILFDFYIDVGENTAETIIFIKDVSIPKELSKELFLAYSDFSVLEQKLPILLKTSYERYCSKVIEIY